MKILGNGQMNRNVEVVLDPRLPIPSSRYTNQRLVRSYLSFTRSVHQFKFSVPLPTPIPTLGPAIARLTEAFTALTTSHATNSHSMTALVEEHAQADARELELRKLITKAEEKRSWFAAFRGWVESVATFLDEKVRTFVSVHVLTFSFQSNEVSFARKTRG